MLAVRTAPAHRCGVAVLRKFLCSLTVLTLLASPLAAQDAAPPTEPVAPYDADLQRLAEILGALQYLRTLCNAKDGQKWRDQMQQLLDAEAPNGERRRRIVANYNRGYRGFQQTYRTCTSAADIVIRRYLQEGARISRDITARYAN
jgi:uncharacterized protein (TIGR02301 family)